MLKHLKRAGWDLIRPIHSPITRALRRRLGGNYAAHPEMELPPPYESVQLDVERHLYQYLHVSAQDISEIIIVGASEGEEVERLHDTYPKARLLCFEPNPTTYSNLEKKYGKLPYVKLSSLALSDALGRTRFYELDMPGNGSLLEPDMDSWSTFNKWEKKEVVSFEVNVSTLDREAAAIPSIDLLWMDVQGAEGHVLAGAKETLKRTKAVFVEIALAYSPYKGALLFPELSKILSASGFTCVGLGTDAANGTGNAFFVKNLNALVATYLNSSSAAAV